MHIIIKASFHILYSRTETACNNFLEMKVTISCFAFLIHLCAKFQPEVILMVALWNSESGCDEDTDKPSNTGVAQLHYKNYTQEVI